MLFICFSCKRFALNLAAVLLFMLRTFCQAYCEVSLTLLLLKHALYCIVVETTLLPFTIRTNEKVLRVLSKIHKTRCALSFLPVQWKQESKFQRAFSGRFGSFSVAPKVILVISSKIRPLRESGLKRGHQLQNTSQHSRYVVSSQALVC